MTMDFRLDAEEDYIPIKSNDPAFITCQICEHSLRKEYSDYYHHHHDLRAICLDCHARAAVRQYVGSIALCESVTHSFGRYFDSMKSFPAVILIHYDLKVTCVECKQVYTFQLSENLRNEMKTLINSEVDFLRNTPVEYMVEAICDIKERIADLVEEKNFLIAENENLKNLIKC